ncbi:hypothetical protein CGRA01v4_00868 [Colletotrichum graminicola]|nr:hypothetical protein CGRA01v4_00868 [Colletotrichum graminicola]
MLNGRPVPCHAVLWVLAGPTLRGENASLWNSGVEPFIPCFLSFSPALPLDSLAPSLLMFLLEVGPTRNGNPEPNSQWSRKCNPPTLNRTEPGIHGLLARSSGPFPARDG